MRLLLMLGLAATLLAGCSETYEASKNSQVFHRSSCGDARHIKADNAVYFKSRDEAMKAGYRPCDVCKP